MVDTDHAGIVGTAYDPGVRRCRPSDLPPARRGLAAAVRIITALTGDGR